MSATGSIAERYAASFEEVRYAVRLFDRFALVPVECPDRLVAEALAAAMRNAGYDVALLAPDGDAWLGLADDLRKSAAGRKPDRLFVVYGDEVTPAAQRGLALVNQLRDALGPALGAPLLWCGPPRFLEESWAAMPDLWSVRALTVRLVPTEVRLPSERHSERLWFRKGDTDELRALLRSARAQGDGAAVARFGIALADALAASGHTEDARKALLEAGEPTAPPLAFERARLDALLALKEGRIAAASEALAAATALGAGASWARLEGAVAAAAGDLARAETVLTGALAGSSRADAAGLHASRGDVRAGRGDLAGAEADWEAAGAAFRAVGDVRGEAVAEEALAGLAEAGDRAWAARAHLERAADLWGRVDAEEAARLKQRL